MARPKPSAQGELLTHRDEFNNHNHCIKYYKIDNNSLTMPPSMMESQLQLERRWDGGDGDGDGGITSG